MTREEQRAKAAHEYIQSDSVAPGNEILAFGDFIEGAKWADSHPQWIPVEEGLPKEEGRYWCCDDDDGQEELRWKDGHWYGLLDPYPIEGVTHWMPLPVPPGKEE